MSWPNNSIFPDCGLNKPERRFQQDGLATAGGTEQDPRLTAAKLKAYIGQRGWTTPRKLERDVIESENYLRFFILAHWLMLTNARVISRFSTKIHTIATTTACVVARPTPCVPPLVRMP